MRAAEKEANGLKQKIDETDKALAQLDKSAEFIGSDNYLEREARQKLNYKNPDEKVVYVYGNQYNQNPDGNAQTTAPVTASVSQQTSNFWQAWQKIWGWLVSR